MDLTVARDYILLLFNVQLPYNAYISGGSSRCFSGFFLLDWSFRLGAASALKSAGSYIVEFNIPAYPGLYPSFLIFIPKPRPKGLGAFHKQLAATTLIGGLTSSFKYLIMGFIGLSTSLPPYSLYKSLLLELVRFRTA